MTVRCIDLFAGWGGFTSGALAAGAQVLWAANHWPLAVEAHASNHPNTMHACQDVRQADWGSLPEFDVLLASPACQGHSTASQPARRRYHDELRSTAWAVVDCADATEPAALVVENVPSFKQWRLFNVWCQALAALGYTLTEHLLTASRWGVPQRRTRLFIVGLRGSAAGRLRLADPEVPEPAFWPHLDPKAPGWRPITAASPGAQARIRSAQARSGRDCLVQHVTGHPGVPVHEPIRTITTKDQWAVVRGSKYRPLTIREYARAMGFDDSYQWPRSSRADAVLGIGNAVCPPVAAGVVRAVREATGL